MDPIMQGVPTMADAAASQATSAPQVPVVRVLDHVTNVPMDIPETDLEHALASGRYTLPLDHSVTMKAPGGELRDISATEAYKALHSGYQVETADEKLARENEKLYGDRLVESSLQGAARGLTFGLSDVAQTATGFRTAKELEGMRSTNPTASTIGEIGGVVGGLLGPTEAGLLVKGAEKTGQLVTKGLTKQLAKAGIENKVAKALVQKIIPTGAGLATEGALYGAGSAITEASLGNEQFNAENLAAHMGMGALIGGATGVGIGAVGEVLAPVATKIAEKSGAAKMANALEHTEVPADVFHAKISEVTKNENPMFKANITPYTAEEYKGFKTFLSADGKSGYAIKPDGELISVFSTVKGRGEQLVDDAIVNKGATKLDAFDINGKLPKLYGKYMDETSRLKFADEYAPKDWEFDKLGRPDVVMMSVNPDKVLKATSLGAKTAEVTSNLARKAVEPFVNPSKAAMELVGLTPAKMASLSERAPQFVDALPTWLRETVGLKTLDSSEAIASKIANVKEAAGKAIGDTMEVLENSGQKIGREVWERTADKLEREVLAPFEKTPGYSAEVTRLKNYINDVRTMVIEAREFGPKQIHTLLKQTDQLINWSKAAQDLPLIQDAAKLVRNELRTEINAIADKVGGNVGKTLKEANSNYYMASQVLDAASKKAEKASFGGLKDATLGILAAQGPLGMAAAAATKFAQSDLRRKMVVLANIERAQQKVYGAMEKGVNGFFKAVEVSGKAAKATIMTTDFSRNEKNKKPQSKVEAFTNLQKNLGNLAANPEKVIERSNRVTSSMFQHAPNTSGAVDAVAVSAVSFLSSKLPKRASAPGVLGVQKPFVPPDYELAKFERYLTAVEQPLSVIHDMQKGKLTHEGVETLQAVYPEIYKKLKDQVIEKLTGPEAASLPYNKKLQLGTLMGVPVDESMMGANVLGLQSNFSQQQAPEGQKAVKTSQKGLEKLQKGEKMQTVTQGEIER